MYAYSPTLLSSASGVIEAQTAMRRRFYERNRVPVLSGSAWFADAHTLEVRTAQGTARLVRAEHIVIATGSRPYHPPELDFSHPRVRDSDSILRYDGNPFVVAIFGAGVIGCEYASIFLTLGCKVTLIDTHEQGCVIHHHEQFSQLHAREEDLVLELLSGRRIRCDLLLWANGRTGNTDGMNLPAVGQVGRASFKSLARAQLVSERIGMLKLLFHTQTLRVLGVHCFGDGAAQIVHIGQTVMAGNDINNVRFFTETTFNYPTMAEAYRVAAYNGLNRLT